MIKDLLDLVEEEIIEATLIDAVIKRHFVAGLRKR